MPLFASLTPEFIDSLRDRVELVRFGKGDVICRQGDIADSFYLVRIGFVKVTEEHPQGELVLAIWAAADTSARSDLLGMGEGGRRTATCTALDHVEVVRISAEDFHRMMDAFPEVRSSLEAVAHEHLEQNRQRAGAQPPMSRSIRFLAQGLMEAQSLLVLDLEKCTRCDDCVRACADAHDGVTRLIREGLRFDNYPGRDLLPPVPRSVVHGGLSGGLDPARAIRSKSSSRTGASAAACAPRTAPTATSSCIRSK